MLVVAKGRAQARRNSLFWVSEKDCGSSDGSRALLRKIGTRLLPGCMIELRPRNALHGVVDSCICQVH
jgi:hypothetical protein